MFVSTSIEVPIQYVSYVVTYLFNMNVYLFSEFWTKILCSININILLFYNAMVLYISYIQFPAVDTCKYYR